MKTIHTIVLLLSSLAMHPAWGQATPGSITPADRSVTSWTSVNLTHTGSSGIDSRQWQLSTDGGNTWTDISGATSANCSTGSLSNSGAVNLIRQYRVKINGQELYSAESAITVIADVTPGSITPAEQTIDAGGSLTLTHTGSDGINWRQWQVSTDNGNTWSNISGDATYSTGALANSGTAAITRKYRIRINDKEIYSAESAITINCGEATPGSITPASRSVTSWTSVNLTHTDASGVASRQWQLSTDGGSTWTDISGATSASCNTGSLNNSGAVDLIRQYRVKVNGQELYSAESAITVIADITPGSISPAEQTVGAGGSLTLTHTGSNGINWRQWQVSTDNGSTWSNISNTDNATYGTGVLANSGTTAITRKYRIRINDKEVYSAESTITVTGNITPGSIAPATQTVVSGGSVALTNSGGTGITSRQWQLSTDNGSTWADISGATTATYNTGTLTNTGSSAITRKYRVKMNDQAVYSAESVITVSVAVTPGSITPATQTVASGGSVELTHSGSTGITSRQWQSSADNGTTWTDITGATTDTYAETLTNTGSSDITRRYRVKINGQAVYSAESVITVIVAVTVGAIAGKSQGTALGLRAYYIHTYFTGVNSRQWQQSFDNRNTWTDIPGATDISYEPGPLTNTDTTTISMWLRIKINGQDIYTPEISDPVPPPGIIIPLSQTVASGSSATLTHLSFTNEYMKRTLLQSTDNGVTWIYVDASSENIFHTRGLSNSGSTDITIKYKVSINGFDLYSAESEVIVIPRVIPGQATQVSKNGVISLTHSSSNGINSRQWQTSINYGSWTDIPGATEATYEPGIMTNSSSNPITVGFRVKCNGQEIYSIGTYIQVPVTVATGTITSVIDTIPPYYFMTLTHTGSNGVRYRQWQRSTDNGNTWADLSGETQATYKMGFHPNTSSTDITHKYRVKLNDMPTVFSGEYEITFNAFTPGIITSAFESDGSVTLTHTGSANVTSRQWQQLSSNERTDIPDATDVTYNTGTFTDTEYERPYWLIINGVYLSKVYYAYPPGDIDPASKTLASGGSQTLRHYVKKTISVPEWNQRITSRQWQLSTDNGITWTDIPGATLYDYATGALTNSSDIPVTHKYRVKVNGITNSIESVITINPASAITVGGLTPASKTISSGGSVVITSDGGMDEVYLTRRWQLSTDNGITWTDIPGASALSYNTGTLTNTGTKDIIRKYRIIGMRYLGGVIYSGVSVITVQGSGGDDGGGDEGGGSSGGGGGNFPEGTVRLTYDYTGNRVTRNKVINMTTMTKSTMTKSAVAETGVDEEGSDPKEETPETEIPKFEEILTETKIVIYPNPTQGMLQIDITGGEISKDAKIQIFNQSGNLVRQVNGISGSNVVDISSQSSGIYLLRITLNKDQVSVWKVIKD